MTSRPAPATRRWNGVIRRMESEDVQGVAALQTACFPPPFPSDLLWQPEHLLSHLRLFPEGQLVAEHQGQVIGSASSLLISAEVWKRHPSWDDLTGGLNLSGHVPTGRLLYGADISVHPSMRGQGVARALYQARFKLVREMALDAYVTSCRLPGFSASGLEDPVDYANQVAEGRATDATLTPLLKMGLAYCGVARDTMDDPESGNAAALLKWSPGS